jgi:3-methyladenine DNA glycosylase AlkC
MAEKFLLKNVFNPENIKALAGRLEESWTDFPREDFLKQVLENFEKLSFSERNSVIAEALNDFLPKAYLRALEVIRGSLGEELPENDLEGYEGFIYMPVCTFVVIAGVDNFDESMEIQEELTKRFTAEFSIRYFLKDYPLETMKWMAKWAKSENCHVRRLASEGCRPRLPMSIRLHRFVKDPREVMQILEVLKNDSELYVRRSVANNLNDISKDHPDVVTDTLTRWQAEKVYPWLIKHALRTLLKQGNKRALKLCGYNVDQQVFCQNFKIENERICLGENLNFTFDLECSQRGFFMVDFVVHHMKANGKLKPKVFKLSKAEFQGNKNFQGVYKIRQMTTRKYYSGLHKLQIQVNGEVVASKDFFLAV